LLELAPAQKSDLGQGSPGPVETGVGLIVPELTSDRFLLTPLYTGARSHPLDLPEKSS